MIEAWLRRFAESPMRTWAVIIVILAIGLLAISPATDDYTDLRDCRTRLRARVAKARGGVAGLAEVRREARQKQRRLAELRARLVPADEVHLFRQEVVGLARSSGCRIRRIRVGSPLTRAWKEAVPPGGPAAAGGRGKEKKPPYELIEQPFFLSVSGTLSSTKGLLAQLQAMDRSVRRKSLSLQPSRENPNEVVLEMELLLFDLGRVERTRG